MRWIWICRELWSQSPDVWEFGVLQQQAEALFARCATALDRGHVRLVKNKIDRFAELKRRRDSVNTAMAETDRRNQGLAVAPKSRTVAARFDGIGILRPVLSKDPQNAAVCIGRRKRSGASSHLRLGSPRRESSRPSQPSSRPNRHPRPTRRSQQAPSNSQTHHAAWWCCASLEIKWSRSM